MVTAHNLISHIGCVISSLAAAYGLLAEELIVMLVSFAGGLFSLLVFVCGRIEARRLLNEEKRRTAIIERLLEGLHGCDVDEKRRVLTRLVQVKRNRGHEA